MGQVLHVSGRVLNRDGMPVPNAKLDIWQANSFGRYRHPSDRNPAPLDPNFNGFAELASDADGSYRFVTIRPSPYPVAANIIRPAHIHFEVTGRLNRIVTQMYFEDDPYNVSDRWLQSATRPEALIVRPQLPTPDFEPDSRVVTFDIVLIDGWSSLPVFGRWKSQNAPSAAAQVRNAVSASSFRTVSLNFAPHATRA
jgi:protocatechuate 3,4-dioxygenase, beta subunit